jgi:hypothetical protein
MIMIVAECDKNDSEMVAGFITFCGSLFNKRFYSL